MFRIYPAVDIKGGRCVRLHQGDMSKETVYGGRPWEVACNWEMMGASFLHVVDLDGAREGKPVNLESVEAIIHAVKVPVQVGGGARMGEDVELLLSLGAARVILGTRALEDPGFAAEMMGEFGERVIVSVDARGGRVALKGWEEETDMDAVKAVELLASLGAKRAIYTDIARDGTLGGHDTSRLDPLLGRGVGIIAAGGISGLGDLISLKERVPRGVEGAVVGKAIYTGDLDLARALELEEV